jgi:hypothetical protein
VLAIWISLLRHPENLALHARSPMGDPWRGNPALLVASQRCGLRGMDENRSDAIPAQVNGIVERIIVIK